MKVYPIDGTYRISSRFGEKRTYTNTQGKTITDVHTGVDFVGISSSKVVSVTEGKVGWIKNSGNSGYGLHVWVINNDGTGALYAHLASCSVSQGQVLIAGSKIGIQGKSGNVTGVHLHLEIHSKTIYKYNTDLVDPCMYLSMDYNQQNGSTVDTTYKQDNTQVSIDSDSTVSETRYIYKVVGSGKYGGYGLYNRKYRIMVVNKNGRGLNVSNLRCTFDISRVGYTEPTFSEVTIYNLSPSTENKLIKNAYYVTIEAGYEDSGHYGVIFKGQVLQPIRGKENGTDYYLKLVCIDNQRFMTYGTVCNTFVAQQTMRGVASYCMINTIDANAKATIGSLFFDDIVYPRGKVVFGSSVKELQIMANTCRGNLYFDQGKVNLTTASKIPSNEVVSLSPDSGLIGTPTQIDVQTGGVGVSLKSLMMPMIHLDSLVYLDNSRIKAMQYDYSARQTYSRQLDAAGLYRVIKINHKGDTRGEEWYTEMQAVSQSGALPGLMSNDTMYPW